MDIRKVLVTELAKQLNKEESFVDGIIEKSPKSEMGDFCIPCFKLAKELRKSPIQIAEELKSKNIFSLASKTEVIGGYLNIFIDKKIYIKEVLEEIYLKKEKYGSTLEGVNKKALVEHTSINPNASPHIGRARNALIGDSIVKLFRFNSYDVEVHYFVNDIGKQISMLLVGTKDMKDISFDDLLNVYVDINKKLEENKELEKEVFDNLNKLENGDKEVIAKFRNLVNICIEGQKNILAKLNIHYDSFDFESDFILNGEVINVLNKLKETGKLFEAEDGRLAINQEEYKLPMKSPVLVVTRADKTSLYPLRDICYSIYKAKRGTDRNVVVLGEDQKLYFKQIAAALDLLGVKAPEVVHYSFVLLPEGKMSTRNGTVVLLEDFMKEILDKTKEELAKRNDGEVDEEKAKKLAYGAVKYTILKGSLEKNVIFDLEKSLSFEGDTSLFIQYNYARIMSLLEKANVESLDFECNYELLTENQEMELIKKLDNFKQVVISFSKKLTPNIVANYVYELTKMFSGYYHDVSILNAESEDIKLARLKLCNAVAIVTKTCLELLGIETVDKM